MSISEKLAAARERLNALKADNDGWTPRESKNEAIVLEKVHGPNKENVPIRIAKATISVDAPARIVFEEELKGWNVPTLAELKVVDEPEKGKTQVLYALQKTLSAASARRDLVIARTYEEGPNRYFVYMTSVTHPAAPVKQEYVRADLLYAGFFIEEAGARTNITYISCLDFGAFIHEKFLEGEVVRCGQRLVKIKERSLQKLAK